DDDVVHMALAHAGGADAQKARLRLQILERLAAAIAHPGLQPADELVDVECEAALVRHSPFDALGNELHLGLVTLELAIAAAFLPRLDRSDAAVQLVGAPLVEDRLPGPLLGAGKEAADHDGVRPGGDRLGDVARPAHAAVGDDRHIGACDTLHRPENR